MSRWMMPTLWAWSSASAAWMPSSATRRKNSLAAVELDWAHAAWPIPREAVGDPFEPVAVIPVRLALGDGLRERLAVDELHGVVVHAPLAADGVDRHDVRVVELGGGEGLGLEPAELSWVHGRGEG